MADIISQAQTVGFDFLIVMSGLGLFLFGINTVGEQLKNIAGNRMKSLIDRYTTNPIKGIFVGIIVTALMQSSSATTALVISLVRSGLMSLGQAIGIFMGSNIGTTVTAILIGFNISRIAPYAIVIGAFMELFAKRQKTLNYARLLIAFGALFFGLSLMGDGLKVLADMPVFTQFATTLSTNKLYSLLLGIFMTMLIQSSSATIGILQTLYGQGILTLNASIPILFGANIGTTITAVLSSIGGTKESKKTAVAHISFNLFGTLLFMLSLPYFTKLVQIGSAYLGLNKLMEIAFAHFIFNVTTTLLLVPFIKQIESFVNLIIKGEDQRELSVETVFEKSIIHESPVMALGVALSGTLEMAENCKGIFKETRCYINTGSRECAKAAQKHEDLVNELNRVLSGYLVDISGHTLNEDNTVYLNFLIYSIKDIERIGDHLLNIVTHFDSIYEQNETISDEGVLELEALMNIIEMLLDELYLVIESPSHYHIDRLYKMEDDINRLEKQARKAFIERLKERVPMGPLVMALYVDILSDFERVGDYSFNVASRLKETILN
ncbi:MAG: Na/Pi cotransporter family protein [Erysipelothrix sp.]|nr:Na/Pi cotransporter family protein [Erysipelothrix sp.]